MKQKKYFIPLIAAILLFSGCSLTSSGTDGGVFRSDNGGKTFLQKVKIDDKKKISSVDVLSLAADPLNPKVIYIGTKSSGIFKTEDSGETWKSLKVLNYSLTKVYALAIDPSQSAVVYAAALAGKRGKILKTEDGGQNWKEIFSEPSSGSLVLNLSIDAKNSQNMYAGTDRGQIIFTENGGQAWRNLFQADDAVFKIVQDKFNSNLVYFAVYQEGILVTHDGGKTFEDLKKKAKGNQEINLGDPTAIVIDPEKENWVYAGTSSGLLRSKDAGNSWELIRTLSLPDKFPVRSIAINPRNSDEIIYSAAQDFYKSNDGGVNWATTQFVGTRVMETIAYAPEDPSIIYVGMNKR